MSRTAFPWSVVNERQHLVPQVAISASGWHYTRALWPQGDDLNRVVGPLLGWLGGDGILPSLRAPMPESGHGMMALAVIAAFNLAIWIVVRRRPSSTP